VDGFGLPIFAMNISLVNDDTSRADRAPAGATDTGRDGEPLVGP
jgi:hypothetical protein